MKSIRIHSYGNSNELKLEDVPNPSIRSNEALVRVHAAGVNPFDWKFREGWFKNWMTATFPLTLGVDYAGDIALVGTRSPRSSPRRRARRTSCGTIFSFTRRTRVTSAGASTSGGTARR